MLSLLIPVFNEQDAIGTTIHTALTTLKGIGKPFEILVINDGSTDKTRETLEAMKIPELRIVHHPRNIGYSAALKTGIRHSAGDVLAITDADGTYPIEALKELVADMDLHDADMTVGARTKAGVKIPFVRKPAKFIVNTLANILTGMRIPDLNSGLRVFKKTLAERFMHLYPQRFSFTTTITLAALTNDYIVTYVPISYHKRIGQSTLSAGTNGIKNFVAFLGLVIRVVTYFRPLRFFGGLAVALLLAGIALMAYTVFAEQNISDTGLLLFLSGLQILLFGLLAEVTVRTRIDR